MEYFDFEDASHCQLDKAAGAIAQTFQEVQAATKTPQFHPTLEGLLVGDRGQFSDGEHAKQPDYPAPHLDETKRLRVNNTYVEVERHPDDFDGRFPMFRAKTPCDWCRRMGLDCFIAQRGALINGCTCCISLYRECSFTFTQKQQTGNYLDILGKVTEDAQECEGSIVTKKTLKSMPGNGGFDESRARKNGARLSKEATKILKGWLSEHTNHPYPNDVEKDRLKELTGLKRSQIANWLANARRRGKVRSVASLTASPSIGAIDIPQPPSTSLGLQDMSPMERWKHSPPEHEAASATAILQAVESAPLVGGSSSSHTSLHNSRQGSRRTSSNDDSSFSMFQAPSLSSLETSRSSASAFSHTSGLSHISRGSFGSFDQKERRRRRRAPIQRRAPLKTRGARIFQCTFCADTFTSKYDWQRHEKSLHLALERWVCSPHGGVEQVEGQAVCVFCRAPNPSSQHLETHNFMACQEKTATERTFYRKDHLRQHLKLLHAVKFDSLMESWKSVMSNIKSSCGFCPCEFTNWEQRADHLAAHFKNGVDMSDWVNGWGFEPHIERLVENSVPPYLNSNERASMDPFVARPMTPNSSEDIQMICGAPAVPSILADSNCWRRLEQVLSGYIIRQKAMGHVPTDKELQNQGRLIVYDDDDPWNQTAADNDTWLTALKATHGIGPNAGLPETRLEEVPIMPPYAVPGGLKHGRGIGCPSERSRLGKSLAPASENISSSAPADLDPFLDIDFNQLNFDSMEVTMAESEGGQNMPLLMNPFDSAMLQVTQQQNASAVPAGGGWALPLPLESGETYHGSIEEAGMSEQDLNQLSGYMASFKG